MIIDDQLNFDKHISEKVKKAISISALIRRIFQHLDEKSFIPLYKTLVRTHLDYASSVWHPYKAQQIEMIEGVQRRATKQIPGLSELSYEERLKRLKLPTLTYRRNRGDMIEVYKILTGKYDRGVANFIKLRKDHITREEGRGHSKRIYIQRPKLNIRKHSFTVRVANLWNSLPEEVVNAKSVNSFKNKLDKHWRNQEVLYNYKAKYDTQYTGSHKQCKNISLQSTESDEEDLRTCVGKPP